MNIEIISGSPRKESVTNRVALFLQRTLRNRTHHEVNMIDVREWGVQCLQEEIYSSVENAPEEFQPLVKRMLAAEGFIIVSPEYNGSYTAAVKNLFDHFPKQTHKPFGIVTASPGALGGIRAALQLQLFICALFGIPSPYMLVTPAVEKKFDTDGNLIDQSFKKATEVFIDEYLWLAESLKPEAVYN
ncbi:MAG: NAD(P)H-dependent oxidoreductase [Segetibacter sp.]|jgi:NAD(P)H-dependent FMN reductase|nr:NAD(P)H-dependent oxidoreductase [Segetibacter sp.]